MLGYLKEIKLKSQELTIPALMEKKRIDKKKAGTL